MRCFRRMMDNSLRDKIINEDSRKQLGAMAAIDHIKREQKIILGML
jgi:hypothetical protein